MSLSDYKAIAAVVKLPNCHLKETFKVNFPLKIFGTLKVSGISTIVLKPKLVYFVLDAECREYNLFFKWMAESYCAGLLALFIELDDDQKKG